MGMVGRDFFSPCRTKVRAFVRAFVRRDDVTLGACGLPDLSVQVSPAHGLQVDAAFSHKEVVGMFGGAFCRDRGGDVVGQSGRAGKEAHALQVDASFLHEKIVRVVLGALRFYGGFGEFVGSRNAADQAGRDQSKARHWKSFLIGQFLVDLICAAVRLSTAGRMWAGVAALVALPALVQASCAPRDRVIARLSDEYGEVLLALGQRSETVLLEVWASRDTGTWTVLETAPDGMTCVVATGTAWEDAFAVVTVPGVPG